MATLVETGIRTTSQVGGPGRTIASVLTLFAATVVSMTLVAIGTVVAASTLGWSLENPLTLIALTVPPQALMFVVGYWFVTRRLDSFSLAVPSRMGATLVVGATALVLAIQFASQAVMSTLGISTPDDSLVGVLASDPLVAIAYGLTMLIIVAPAEELLFRGAIQGGLRTRFGAGFAIAGSAVLFGLMHITQYLVFGMPLTTAIWLSLGFITINGLVYGLLYERTRNLLVPILVHGFYNIGLLAAFTLGA